MEESERSDCDGSSSLEDGDEDGLDSSGPSIDFPLVSGTANIETMRTRAEMMRKIRKVYVSVMASVKGR